MAAAAPGECCPTELLALLGGRGREVRRAAHRLCADHHLVELSRFTAADFARQAGLGELASRRLEAAFELGRRVVRSQRQRRPRLATPARVHELVGPELRGLQQESFEALILDGKHRLRRRVPISLGTLTSSLVHPREFFRPALREGAAAVIAVHNHPSGDPEPSAEDIAVTRRLWEAGQLLGVPLLDHVVLGDGCFVSLQERLGFTASSPPGPPASGCAPA